MTQPQHHSLNRVPRRRVPVWLLFVILTIVLGGALVAFYLLRPIEGPLPSNVATHYAGIERGMTEQGFPRLGSASAPVLIENFSSYACPHCRTLHGDQFEALLDEIAAGNIQWVMIPVPQIGRGSETAALGSYCAGEQGKFWEMHDTLFYWQGKYMTSIFDERRVKLGAEKLGLDTDLFNACLDSREASAFADAAREEFERRGLSGTPSLFLNGERVTDYREIESLIPGYDAAA